MWRLWGAIKWIWIGGLAAVAFAVLGQLLFAPVRKEVIDSLLSTPGFVTVALLLVLLIAATLASGLSHRTHERDELFRREFALCIESEKLRPEDFGYRIATPGEGQVGVARPYFDSYIHRRLVRLGEEAPLPLTKSAEEVLSSELQRGGAFAIVGEPCDGKTRTIYEAIKRLKGFRIIRLRPRHFPLPDAIREAVDRPVVLIFDDLDHYGEDSAGMEDCVSGFKLRNPICAIAATCRGPKELKDSLGKSQGAFSRFYESIPSKYQLDRPTANEKMQLWHDVRPGDRQPDLSAIATFGQICMADALAAMRGRYKQLSPAIRDCLLGICLLTHFRVIPTHSRIRVVVEKVLKRILSDLSDALNELETNGFLRSTGDPVSHEAAYVRWKGAGGIVVYPANGQAEDYIESLQQALLDSGDANGLVSLGIGLGESNRRDDEIAVYDVVVTRFAGTTEPALRQAAAYALFNKAVTFGQLNRPQSEIETYDDLVFRFGDATTPALRKLVGNALVNKGFRLGQLNRVDEELATYDSVVGRFDDSQEVDMRVVVASALINKGFRLQQLERGIEALKIYDSLLARIGDAKEPALLRQVVRVLVNKGVTLGKLHRFDEAVPIFDAVVAHFGTSPVPSLREQVAKALVNKATVLAESNRPVEALEVCESVVVRYGNAVESVLRELVAKALINKGLVLLTSSQFAAALEVFEAVIIRLGDSMEPGLRELVAIAVASKGTALGNSGRDDEAIAVYDGVVARFGGEADSTFRTQVARVLFNKSTALANLDRDSAAMAVCEEVIRRFADSTEPAVLEVIARARALKDSLLRKGGR